MTTVDVAAEPKRLVSTRVLTWTQFLYASWYLLCAGIALWRAADLRGRPYIPAQGDVYTASIEIWPGALRSVYTFLLYTAAFGHIFAVSMVCLAAVRLADRRVWTQRGTRIRLLIGAAMVVGTLALAFSPPGQAVRNWIMD